MSEYLPHQQRVVDENADLCTKIEALNSFINTSPVFSALSKTEKNRLTDQIAFMRAYARILLDRIDNF